MANQIPRHFGHVRGEEVVIVGHHKGMNSCLIVRLSNLPQDEAEQLRRIAMSITAQNLNYLVPTLRVELHKSTTDWFTYLVTRLQRGDGSVLNMPIKEIDAMNEDQKAFFKGYGPGVEPENGPSRRVGKDSEFRVPLVDGKGDLVADDEKPQKSPASLSEAQAQGIMPPPTPATDPEMARAAQQASGGTNQNDVNMAILEALKGIQEGQKEMTEQLGKLKPARKTTVRKKAATRKKSASGTPNPSTLGIGMEA